MVFLGKERLSGDTASSYREGDQVLSRRAWLYIVVISVPLNKVRDTGRNGNGGTVSRIMV